jgi:hypothetical protein
LRKATINFVMSVRLSIRKSAWNNSAPTGRIFTKFDNFSKIRWEDSGFTKIGQEKMQLYLEIISIFFIISRSFLLRMRNSSDKSCRENTNTHFVFSNVFSRKSCCLWDIVEKYCRAGGWWSVPRPGRLTPVKDPVPIFQGIGWAPGPVWTCTKNLAPTGIRSSELPARSQSLYRLS